jgi:glycosyltransferase involved in cell wall biosynthesis
VKSLPARRTALIVTPYFPPAGGGLERYARQIADRLKKEHGWRVVMVAATGTLGAKDSKQTIAGITVYQLSYRLRLSNTPFGFGWRRKLKRIIATENPTIINAHMPVPGLADVAASVAGRLPFVLTYHTGTMKKGTKLTDGAIGLYERFQLPRLLKRAERVICSSDFVRDDFLADWSHKTITITPGADEQLFAPRPHAAGPKQGRSLILVANFGPAYRFKGLEGAIRALAKIAPAHPDLTLKVVGEGDHGFYEQIALKLGVRDKLQFLGLQAPTELAKLYQEASILVLPTSNDSFPMVIVEAMAAGLPVVSTTVGGIPTIIDSGQSGLLVSPGDTGALAAAVERLLSDPGFAAKLAAAGREKVLATLTWAQKAHATHAVFEQALTPHICQITAYYPPHIGGIENVVQELSRNLATQGYTVDVLTSHGREHSAAEAEPSGLRVFRLPSFEALNTPVMRGLFTRIMRQPKRTIIHLHAAQAITPEITWLAARLRKLPLVTHFHLDIEPSSAVGEVIFGPYKRLFLRFVLRHSDRLIFLTEEQRTAMVQKYDLKPERTHVMPNGVADDYFLPARQSFHKPLRLLFVGRLAVQKRPERIVAAMADLPQAHLDVVGEGEARTSLARLAAQSPLGNVTFHGPKFGADLRALYHNADVMVLPSDREGMPLVLLEAMAAGLPVVGSDVPGIRELVRGTGILVPNPSAAAFAAALAPLARDHAELRRLSAASRSTAEAYSWSRLARGLTTLYHKLAP